MDITKAQFADFNNTAGKVTFSYAQLLAQLQNDISGGASVQIGKGCHATGGGSIAAGGRSAVPFTASVFDDLGFLDIGGANPERMTIPDVDPPIKRVMIGGYQNWSIVVVGTVRTLVFVKNFGLVPGGDSMQIPLTDIPGDNNRTLAMSPPVDVVAGDWFETQAFTTGGAGAATGIIVAGWLIVLQ